MKKNYPIGIIIAIIILALAIVISAVIISNSNKSDYEQVNDNSGIVSYNNVEDYGNIPTDTNNAKTCKAEGTGCLSTSDCCGAMLCCRPQGYSSGYCAVSCA